MFHYEDGTTHLFSTSVEQYEYYSKRFRMGLNHPATFVPRIIYDQIGLFDERFSLYADADFFISLILKMVNVDEEKRCDFIQLEQIFQDII